MRSCFRFLLCGLFRAASLTPVAGFMPGGDIFDLVFMTATPGYRMTAQDYLSGGNYWKERCASVTAEVTRERAACGSAESNAARDASNTAVNSKYSRYPDLGRLFLGTDKTGYGSATSSRGKLVMDAPPAAIDPCVKARRAYERAFQLTADDDHAAKAEILEAGAGITPSSV